jgi:hypothetical protein
MNFGSVPQKNNASAYLKQAGKFWFIAATIGLYAFGMYVILYYAKTAATNHLEIWNKNLFSGIIPGDWLGNIFLVFHILLASVILFGGPLQFMPFIRNRFRRFHRYLGRTYLMLAVLIALTGVVMTLKGKSFGSVFMQTITSLSAIYICWFAIMTVKNARKKDFRIHRQWALRLFMVANGVWFIRIWPGAWSILSNNHLGPYPENVAGILTYVLPLPLIFLELYFLALKKKQAFFQLITAIFIFLFTLIMIVGIYRAINSMWLPKVQSVY